MEELGNIEGSLDIQPSEDGYTFTLKAKGIIDTEIEKEELAAILLASLKQRLNIENK